MSRIHIYAPSATEAVIRSLDCPTCKRRRFALCLHYEWFGPDMTCLGCGERWNEDGRAERPFARGWRKESIRQAREAGKRYRAKFGKPVVWRDA